MILKEMIDKHFSEAAAVTSPSPVSPVNNRINTAGIASHVRHVSLYTVSPVSPVNNRINTAGIASHVRHVSLYTVSPVSPVNNRINTAFLSVHRMARFARA